MRKTREILRLRWGKSLTQKQTSLSCNCSQSHVHRSVSRAKAAGLSWPLPEGLDDEALEKLLYPKHQSSQGKAEPDFRKLHLERGKKGVTLLLLWQEYRLVHPDGYGYSQYCNLYKDWRKGLEVSMRQTHKPGEKLYVDYAGQKLEIIDPSTGEVKECSVFVAAMGLSQYIYAEATEDQGLISWLTAHEHTFEYLEGSVEVLVPDNLKSGVTKPCFYDPEINRSYKELADYYGAYVLPARVRKPKDKAKVENAVLQVERWVLAPLRKQQFFSIPEANRAIRQRLDWLNNRPLSKLDQSRRQLFIEYDKPKLKRLPYKRFEVPGWKLNVGVNIDHHFEFEGHYYSVPFTLIRKRVEIRFTALTVECFYNGKRVAVHQRSRQKGRHTTVEAHRPKAHREWAGYSPSRMLQWAGTIGPETQDTVKYLMEQRRYPEQSYRSCMGIIRLSKKYHKHRVEDACKRARMIGARTYRSIHSILKNGLDQTPITKPEVEIEPIDHSNIRGPFYYH